MSDWFGGETAKDVLNLQLPEHQWLVVRTRSRCEKKFAADLKYYKVCYYLPLYAKASKSARMIVTRELPLFSGYIFVHTDFDKRYFIEDHFLSAGLIDIPNVPLFVSELSNIERALSVSKTVTPVDGFVAGTRVRVKKGPLIGLIGEVLYIKNKFRLVLKASIIGQSVSMEIDAANIEEIVE